MHTAIRTGQTTRPVSRFIYFYQLLLRLGGKVTHSPLTTLSPLAHPVKCRTAISPSSLWLTLRVTGNYGLPGEAKKWRDTNLVNKSSKTCRVRALSLHTLSLHCVHWPYSTVRSQVNLSIVEFVLFSV